MSLTEETPPSHQLTSCGRVCLTWIALQYAVRLDQLRRLLYRYTPEADRYKLKSEVDFLSLDRVYKWINKMLDFGLIEKKTILHGDQTWIWLSRALAHSQARSLKASSKWRNTCIIPLGRLSISLFSFRNQI